MLPRSRNIWALLFFILVLTHFSTATHLGKRQDDNSVPAQISEASSAIQSDSATETASVSNLDQTSSPSETKSQSESATSLPATSTRDASTSEPNTATYTGSLVASPTVTPANGLPIEIRVTPAFGVAGILLMGAGGTLTLWKNRFSQTFLANGLLASLATSVLIIYVMETPVSDGIEGAYLVAVVLTGAFLGVVSSFFREITESLGCLLGGFCMGMWLLTLHSQGLIHSSVGTIIFIAICCIAGWATCWSRFTRDWAIIICMSFSGATAFVLGVDCFSRAGLKEFWVYIWDINSDFFIQGMDFNLTKGIRVESAAVIIFFVAGIVAQTYLWRKIKARKDAKIAEEKAARADIEAQDEAAGCAIQAKIAAERTAWERQYGEVTEFHDNEDPEMTRQSSKDSGVQGISYSEKQLQQMSGASEDDFVVSHPGPADGPADGPAIQVHQDDGTVSTLTRTMSSATRRSQLTVNRDLIAPASLAYPPDSPLIPPRSPERASPLMKSAYAQNPTVMVRVSRDDTVLTPRMVENNLDIEEQAWIAAREIPRVTSSTVAPDVVPLPFNVEKEEDDDADIKTTSNRSSIATFNDNEEGSVSQSRRGSRTSIRRMSQGARSLLRTISHKSGQELSEEERMMLRDTEGPTLEDIMEARIQAEEDDMSVAATFDGAESRISIIVDAKLGSEQDDEDETATIKDGKVVKTGIVAIDQGISKPSETKEATEEGKSEVAVEDKENTGVEVSETEPSTSQDEDKTCESPESDTKAQERNNLAVPSDSESSISHSSSSVSLTKDVLPEAFSRIALKYRTNEWVKHSTTADALDPEALVIEPLETEIASEPSALVDINDLSLSAADITIPTARLSRSYSSSSGSTRIPAIVTPPEGNRSSIAGSIRSRSASFNGRASVRSSIALDGFARPAPPTGIQSFDSPQTLLGQRDLYLKAKTQLTHLTHLTQLTQLTQLPWSVSDSNFGQYEFGADVDDDDAAADGIPLSQRRHLIRRSATMATMGVAPVSPRRSIMGAAQQESRLASFRESIHQDVAVRMSSSNSTGNLLNNGIRSSVLGSHGLPQAAVPSTLKPWSSLVQMGPRYGREDEKILQRQRSVLMGKKEAERVARESILREREFEERRRFERMASGGQLQGAHREMLRRMQQQAK